VKSQQLDEEAVFHIARDLSDTAKRETYLDQVCARDQVLRERVEALLRVYDQEQSFLKSAEPTLAPTVDRGRRTENVGATIGRYKLMEPLGEGGMGTVFVAQQDRPIRRKVALKLIKPGMDSKSVVARFEAERQALAMMDHPNIAKVLDAGTTESGRPYFAMELVKGISITEYCDRNRLTIPERLELFIQVCQAIQHAHQKGIIHRDIKPSNVLVTLHDGRPVPKVIDFGVAKALNARLTDRTIYTEHLQVVGTLLYMSPEQAELSGLDIDTRSDIYSLGVLLYELLTGTTPFPKETLDQAGFDEQRRIIRDKEPPRASVRISSLGKTATAIADHRKTDPAKLNQLIRGDLDWILLKALDKDRTRRYGTAVGFAEDVARFLSDEPIIANPPSTRVRLWKFAKRNQFGVVAGTLIGLSLVLAFASITWYSIKLTRLVDDYRFELTEKALIAAFN
jgi:serine/threonine protein kinase